MNFIQFSEAITTGMKLLVYLGWLACAQVLGQMLRRPDETLGRV